MLQPLKIATFAIAIAGTLTIAAQAAQAGDAVTTRISKGQTKVINHEGRWYDAGAELSIKVAPSGDSYNTMTAKVWTSGHGYFALVPANHDTQTRPAIAPRTGWYYLDLFCTSAGNPAGTCSGYAVLDDIG